MSSDETRFLEVAAQLAHGIADSAIWFDDRCNWIGAQPKRLRATGSLGTYAALGPDLYGGTSGVALFLAEAGATLGDGRLHATALGALRHAFAHADRVDAGARDGLYSGPVGIAYAAARVAARSGTDEALAGARETLLRWRRGRGRSPGSDLDSGCAGALAGLVTLARLLDQDALIDFAVELGEELVARGEVGSEGWSWGSPRHPTGHALCGFAHGAAGIGYALLELHAATGAQRFLEAGEGAFAYERSWFELAGGIWPDLRDIDRRAGNAVPAQTSDSWCNGAAGIALSRLRAVKLIGRAELGHDAKLALAACERQAGDALAHPPGDFSLCHGTAGIADALLHGPHSGLAVEVGRQGIERYLENGAPGFPCGVPRGGTPALLLGLAGIGLFYLRLHDPDIPSPLLVHPGAG